MKIKTPVTFGVFLFVAATACCFGGEVAAEQSLQQLPDQLIQMFDRGGILMWILLGCSVVGLSFTLERLVALRCKTHLPQELPDHVCWLLENEGVDSAVTYLRKRGSVLARSLLGVLGSIGDREAMRRELEEELARVLCDERRNIRPVGICATISPLVGLLGTVTGMIEAFRQAAASGMDNPALFAGGIYQALYTTAFGLTVSIPCLVAAFYLKGRLELIVRRSEDRTLEFIDRICEEYEAGELVEEEPERFGFHAA